MKCWILTLSCRALFMCYRVTETWIHHGYSAATFESILTKSVLSEDILLKSISYFWLLQKILEPHCICMMHFQFSVLQDNFRFLRTFEMIEVISCSYIVCSFVIGLVHTFLWKHGVSGLLQETSSVEIVFTSFTRINTFVTPPANISLVPKRN